ncbi:hypothetical protein OVA24_16995 [Luteolibacter sp. SL250]|uniref:hypothetical protein n=1 Tax=Luteolibacter sp. SL250 TaxID=2995170 RepID=UPI00227002E9|nr:hypothetical protein [Luteolibacter sp. SL250]WAC18931.1 hypothetical protein OVA24_16995 [Luteolibacter sp. SL250]
MKTSLQKSGEELLAQALDLLWRQWASLGVPAHHHLYAGDAMLDPEGLLLVTTSLGRHDARLLDMALDWLHKEGARMNVQRLKGLRTAISMPGTAGETMEDDRVLAALAEVLAEKAVMRKWKGLEGTVGAEDRPEEALFHSGNAAAIPLSGMKVDPRFAKHGLLRPPWKPRGASMPPPPDRPANLLLTLRSFVGVNARAEILAWLLARGHGHPAEIARDTCYFSKSIQLTLNEMEQSGMILSERHGREKHFRLRTHDWMAFLGFPEGSPPPRWVAWPWVYYYIRRMIMLLEESGGEDDVSGPLASIRQRDFLEEMAPWLWRSGLRTEMTAETGMKGTRLMDAVLEDVARLGALMKADFQEAAFISS